MATIVSTQDGYWDAASTWVGGVPPAAGDVADMNHNITIRATAADQECASIDIQAAKTLTLEDDTTLTEMTGNTVGTGNLVMGAGCTFVFNSAGTRVVGSIPITVRGTADNRSVITNVDHNISLAGISNLDMEYCDLPTIGNYNTGNIIFRMINCDVIAVSTTSSYGYIRADRIEIRDSWFSGFGHGGGAFNNPAKAIRCFSLENVTYGKSRNGTVAVNAKDFNLGVAQICEVWGRNVLVDKDRITAEHWASRLCIDNWNHRSTDVGIPGLGLVYIRGIMLAYSSTDAAKSGTYGIRVEALTRSGVDASKGEYSRGNLTIPIFISSGQSVAVAGYVRRSGMTTAAARILLDNSENVMTADSDTPVMTNVDTWYAFSVSGTSTRAGTANLVLQLKDYAVGETLDWADVTVTIGTVVYTVNASQWFRGNPLLTTQIAEGIGIILGLTIAFTGGGEVTGQTTALYQRGETAIVSLAIVDADGDAYDPTTSVIISIWDEDGTLQTDSVVMTKAATGSYFYDYDIADSADTGDWKVEITTIDNGRVAIDTGTFRVEDFPTWP